MTEAAARRFGAIVNALVRALVATAPAPRVLPGLGVESATGTGHHLLDGLSARGIFRKYELVLQMGAGLGGHARWMAGRLGCEVVGTTETAAEAAAGMELTQRSAARGQVWLLPARPDALPFGEARFTHVWIVEALPRLGRVGAALAEAHRVVRPGGFIAVQDLVTAGSAPDVPGWCFADAAAREAAIVAAGFVDLQSRDVTADAAERSPRVLGARAQLASQLRDDATLAPLAAERDALAGALDAGALRVVQFLARRA
jgi:SAM-dependent methyltransferase